MKTAESADLLRVKPLSRARRMLRWVFSDAPTSGPQKGQKGQKALVVGLLLIPAAAIAQTRPVVRSEITVLRDSEALESRGDIAGAERLVRNVLAEAPTSLSSLITLERLLTMQGRLADLIPYLDKLLKIDPESVIGHQMQVRMYATVNRPDDLKRAADAWIAVSPTMETPYREIARAYHDRGDLQNALATLERGRKKIGGDALALDLGDAYADTHDYDRAVVEWARAIGTNGQGLLSVQRRVQNLPDGSGASAIPRLVAALRKEPSTIDRKRAAANIAIDAGLPEADALTRQVYKDLPSAEKTAFLLDAARRADANGATRLAYWAYGEAVRVNTDSTRNLGLRTRYAQLALIVGDTAKASRMYADLERAAAPGSAQRRQALAARIQLSAGRGDLEHAVADLKTLRTEYPTVGELDEVASRVASALLDRGDVDGAAGAVEGVLGPRSGAARGRVYMRRGDVERARDEILASAPLLQGAEATEALRLATLIMRMSKPGGELIGRAMAMMADDASDALRMLVTESKALEGNERADILDYAAGVADRTGLAAQAEQIRREIVTEYPKSTVTPASLIALAQVLSVRGEKDDARLMLERVILEHPRSALVPQARRDLDRLLGRVPGG
jgi:tetratricopeptide (TPR) repeat protein